MKRTIKLMSLLLAVCLCFGALIGCSTSKTTTASNGSEQTTEKTLDYPKRTISIEVGSDAGGDQDFTARWIAKKMQEDFGVNVVVNNNSGPAVAARRVKSLDADGYNIYVGKTNVTVEKALGNIDDYDFEDYEFLGTLCNNPGQIIAVKKTLGVNTLAELFAYCDAHPGELRITDNIGSNTQVTVNMLLTAGLKATSVDIGGASLKTTAFLGDHVEIFVGLYSNIKDYIEAGEHIVLGTVSAERNPFFPDVPTCLEQGYQVQFDTSHVMAVKKGTDPEIVAFLSNYLKNIVDNDAQFKEDLANAQQCTPSWADGPTTLKRLQDEVQLLYDIGFATKSDN